MKVVLIENVEHLGIVGDVKDVAPGYARNYLLPKKLAVKSGDKKARALLKTITKKRQKMQKEMQAVKKTAEKFEGKEINFKKKASDKGKLFGSINSKDIAQKLKLDPKQIEMNSIKTVGEHNVKINFGHNIKKSVKIIIESKK